MKNRSIFLTVLKAGNSTIGCQRDRVLVKTFFRIAGGWLTSHLVLRQWRGQVVSTTSCTCPGFPGSSDLLWVPRQRGRMERAKQEAVLTFPEKAMLFSGRGKPSQATACCTLKYLPRLIRERCKLRGREL